MGSRLSIETLRQIQSDKDLGDTHLVSLDEDGFTIAHTDEERASGMDLTECPLVDAMMSVAGLGDGIPSKPGEYIAYPHQPDAYSESYRSGAIGWDFEPLR